MHSARRAFADRTSPSLGWRRKEEKRYAHSSSIPGASFLGCPCCNRESDPSEREMDPSAFVFMALSGEGEHGPSSGAVVVDASKGHAKFTPFGDLHPAPMRKQMRDQAASNPGNLYVLSKTDKHVHVFAYPRDKAAQQLRDGTLPALMP